MSEVEVGTKAEHERLVNLVRRGDLQEANNLALQIARREHHLGGKATVRSPLTVRILQGISERAGVAAICGECGSEINRISLFPASKLISEKYEISKRIAGRGQELGSEWYRNLRQTHDHEGVVSVVVECIVSAVGEQPVVHVEIPELKTIGDYRRALKTIVEGDQFPSPVINDEDGIVYVGGGAYWPGIVLGIRLLRKRGCQLPVQVWHRGQEEPVRPDQVAEMDVRIIDTVEHANARGGARRLGGWEAKLWALTHCGFRRVLYLDADAYCVQNPQPLFDLLGRSEPFLFWYDLLGGYQGSGKYKGATEKHVKWNVVWTPGANGVPPIQGGQLLIDIERFWRPLVCAHWMNQHSDFYYKFMFGDQDTWRVALSAMSPGFGDPLQGNTTDEMFYQSGSFWRSLGSCPWNSPAFVVPFEDKPYIVHRCQGKLFPIHLIPESAKNRPQFLSPKYHLPCESEVFSELAQIIDMDDSSSVFSEVYKKQIWGVQSGPGSSDKEMQPWVQWITSFIRDRSLRTVVEIGCGSGKLSRVYGDRYTGIDCCESILQVARANKKSSFIHADFFADRSVIPECDVLVMKDVLHHWPNRMITEFLTWITVNRKKWKHVIICGDRHQVEDRSDCPLGSYRALSHSMMPLSQFEPQELFQYLHKSVLSLPSVVSDRVMSIWGVGDHMEHLLGRLFSSLPKKTCSCDELKRKMNAWGVEECLRRSDEIVSSVLSNADNLSGISRFAYSVAGDAIASGVIRKVLQVAARRARKFDGTRTEDTRTDTTEK